MSSINLVAVLLATVANMVLGAVWYGQFGESWLQCINKRKEDLNPSSLLPYIVALVGSLVNALAMAYLFRLAGVETLLRGMGMGAALALFVATATAAKHYAFSGWPAKLLAIDYGVDVVGFMIMGGILTMVA